MLGLLLSLGLLTGSPAKPLQPLSNTPPPPTSRPWLNTSLPLETRLGTLVGAMNDTELISQLVKFSQRIDRLGVPAYAWHMEAAHGVQTAGDATVFPCSLARACGWDPALEGRIARAIAVEARAKWNLYWKRHGTTPPYHAEGLSLTLCEPEPWRPCSTVRSIAEHGVRARVGQMRRR